MTTTTNTTIEDWVRTASVEFRNCTQPGGCAICLTAAIEAVIEKHVTQLLWTAYRDGYRDKQLGQPPNSTEAAARILSDLTTGRET